VTQTVCRLADLAATGSVGFQVGEGEWPLRGFVTSLPDGSGVRAWINRCPHARHPLDLLPGRFLTVDRQWIQCSSHGALFAPDSGVCVAGPCVGRSLQSIPIVIEGDEIRLADSSPNGDNARRSP